MYTLVLSLALGQHVPPVVELAQEQVPPTVKEPLTVRTNCGCGYGSPCTCTDGCTCQPLDYDAATKRCAEMRKPLVVFSGVPVRPINGLTVCRGTLAKKGVVIGIPANGWLDRYDLPADVSDDAIRAFIFSKITQRKEVRQQQMSMMPPPFREPEPRIIRASRAAGFTPRFSGQSC